MEFSKLDMIIFFGGIFALVIAVSIGGIPWRRK